jgi:hypothetical protein
MVSLPNSISVLKDTPHFTNTVCSFSYGLYRLYKIIIRASISYRDLNIYVTGSYTSI